MKPRLQAECTESSELELILASCCLSPMMSTVSSCKSVQFGF